MRESPAVQVHLRRFGAWRAAVVSIALAAVAASTAWAVAQAGSHADRDLAVVLAVAGVLSAATIALAVSLARVASGVLASEAGSWTFTPDAGPSRSGALTVAIDLGSFLLLRLESRGHAHVWLPVQRRGLEPEWHALRCAVHSPPRPAPAPRVERGGRE